MRVFDTTGLNLSLAAADLRVLGLPAHPLVVHAAVVLVPLSALAFVALAWRDIWRERYLLPITLLALAGAVAAFVAKETGESLQDVVRPTGKALGEHPEQGDTAFIFAALFGVACTGTFLLYEYGTELRERLGLQARLRLPVSDEIAAYLITAPLALVAVAMLVIAGHSGASLVWKDFP